jgi:hypothetical protein
MEILLRVPVASDATHRHLFVVSLFLDLLLALASDAILLLGLTIIHFVIAIIRFSLSCCILLELLQVWCANSILPRKQVVAPLMGAHATRRQGGGEASSAILLLGEAGGSETANFE